VSSSEDNLEIDLKEAINAISDVIQNRPRPLRRFDQIYMKAADMVLQSEFVARWACDQRLVFVGDGDSIGVCVAYLRHREIIGYGPSQITVLDFDGRIVSSIERFADQEGIENLEALLYNALDPIPSDLTTFELFYTNPPWGASNGGESVNVFVQRGMELIHFDGSGLLVIADKQEGMPWTEDVLANVQRFAADRGFYVSKLMPRLHSYHLDDNPELRSCNLVVQSRPDNSGTADPTRIVDKARLANFYGDGVTPTVHYVRERLRVDYGRAHDDEYELEFLEDNRDE
jgi:predicted methyltransferase